MSAITLLNDNNSLTVNQNNISCNTLDANALDVNNINLDGGDIYITANQSYMPVGSVSIYSGSTSPSGWLLCDGSAISRSTYSRLFAIVGTTYGTGNGTTTFNLPNFQERLPLGKGGSTNLGNTGGSNTVTLSVDQLPSHTHTGTTAVNGSHTHSGSTSTDGLHSHTSNATGGLAQPGLAYSNGYDTTTGVDNDNSNGELNLKYTQALTIDNGGSHSHIFATDSNGDHSHSFTTDATGSGSSINIQNPYIVMNYIIRY
jgi:microcystin-dependent protein